MKTFVAFLFCLSRILDEHISNLINDAAVDSLAAPASEAFVDKIFSVAGDLSLGKKNITEANIEKTSFSEDEPETLELS